MGMTDFAIVYQDLSFRQSLSRNLKVLLRFPIKSFGNDRPLANML